MSAKMKLNKLIFYNFGLYTPNKVAALEKNRKYSYHVSIA